MSRILLIIFISLVTLGVAHAHDWYPFNCCSGNDCHPIPCEAIIEKGKELIYGNFSFSDTMIKPSQDGSCHVCISNEYNKLMTPVPHCIFIQQGS